MLHLRQGFPGLPSFSMRWGNDRLSKQGWIQDRKYSGQGLSQALGHYASIIFEHNSMAKASNIMPAFQQDFCIIRKKKSEEIHQETAKHMYFRGIQPKLERTWVLVNTHIHTGQRFSMCSCHFVCLIFQLVPSPNVIYRIPLKYILVTETFCVYYCVCIDGTFKNNFSKAILQHNSKNFEH